ncbi:uncharacterized protein LY79DRAFT_697503 [Colletotrichum navitas]|uniref:Secreted protein n=1 Tax=Colletotrichum navitas TaxID=681940 RepID=A0AAD8UY87_9PEZI|nr:uncharacterized protein LY79DRAFT_697503 [Colletotrichum navitas]KAK1573476.1 hypothetical protein LY79DRAFT_697503 [Colletotrichum navitas]
MTAALLGDLALLLRLASYILRALEPLDTAQGMTCWLLSHQVSVNTNALLDCLCLSPYIDAIYKTGT